MRTVFILMAALLLGAVSQAYAASLFGDSVESVGAKDGVIRLEASGLGNGQAKFYKYKEDDTIIRFFLVRDNQGTLRAALDACEACWHADKGYKLQDGILLCANCGMRFALGRIGAVRGGCNPHPIAFKNDGDAFTATTRELLSGARYFPDNGR